MINIFIRPKEERFIGFFFFKNTIHTFTEKTVRHIRSAFKQIIFKT